VNAVAEPRLPWLADAMERALGVARDHHALLIHGPAGVGQFELAMDLARAWLCEADVARPCGRCASCMLAAARSHPDLLVLVPEALQEALGWLSDNTAATPSDGSKASRAKPSKEIKVDGVRAATAFAQLTSARGRCKVVVIHPADRMNAVAANALLKTLEEPPGSARFILATGAAPALPPTVRSRCQPLQMTPPPPEVAVAWLKEQGVSDPEVALTAAGGQPLEALAAWTDGVDAQAWERLPDSVRAGDASVLSGWPIARAVDALQKLCHDHLALAVGARPRYFAALRPGADAVPHALHAWAKELSRAARHAEHPWNAGLLVESLVLQGQRACSGLDSHEGAASGRSVHSGA
jgi:DNA polymerase-3 subunit delta'